MKDFSIVIPAAGQACRLKSLKPKALSRFQDGSYLFERTIRTIEDVLGEVPIYYVTGFQHNKIYKKIKSSCEVIENKDFEVSNVAYSTYLGLQAAKTPNVLILYGDLYFNKEVLEQIKSSGENSFVVTDDHNLDDDEVGCLSFNERCARFDYGFPFRWCQIAYLQEQEKQLFKQQACQFVKSLGFEVLNKVIDKGGKFDVIQTEKQCKVVDIDSFKDLKKCNKFIGQE